MGALSDLWSGMAVSRTSSRLALTGLVLTLLPVAGYAVGQRADGVADLTQPSSPVTAVIPVADFNRVQTCDGDACGVTGVDRDLLLQAPAESTGQVLLTVSFKYRAFASTVGLGVATPEGLRAEHKFARLPAVSDWQVEQATFLVSDLPHAEEVTVTLYGLAARRDREPASVAFRNVIVRADYL